MNTWYGIGRLTKDPELRYTNNNKAVCEFSLAVNRPKIKDKEQETDFINFKVWNKLAENLVKYQKKGNMLSVIGSLRVESYDDNDGKKKYKTYVLAEIIQYLSSKKEDEKLSTDDVEKINEPVVEEDPFEKFGRQITIDDSDLPFLKNRS